ncbi:MAG TPA: type II toxin-antitoxin system VapC family toxin [Candidatus Baltobacteraceae bacterium]|jgi:predicted nucleic acid-binding protein|nr:type II toxin-antitoxin system VapC family toxin [Candidatus Baltobacteraceae bacterium]
MRILLDTSLLVEGERRNFDLGKWVMSARHEVFICDATLAEYIAGKPLTDAGKEKRWQNYWDSFVSILESVPLDRHVCEKAGELLAGARLAGKTVPLGDGLHAAVAELEDLTVATVDVDHFKALGVRTVNPLR